MHLNFSCWRKGAHQEAEVCRFQLCRNLQEKFSRSAIALNILRELFHKFQLWARTSNSDRLIPHWPRERRSKTLSSAPFWGEYLENLHAHRKLHAVKSNLGKKTKHCPDPTGRGADDTTHVNADINISYLMGLNHLRSLICTYSADDLRPLMFTWMSVLMQRSRNGVWSKEIITIKIERLCHSVKHLLLNARITE